MTKNMPRWVWKSNGELMHIFSKIWKGHSLQCLKHLNRLKISNSTVGVGARQSLSNVVCSFISSILIGVGSNGLHFFIFLLT